MEDEGRAQGCAAVEVDERVSEYTRGTANGSVLEWGSKDGEFESPHSDQPQDFPCGIFVYWEKR